MPLQRLIRKWVSIATLFLLTSDVNVKPLPCVAFECFEAAYHEAGHAVVAWRLGTVVSEVAIETTGAGLTSLPRRSTSDITDIWNDIAIDYAGGQAVRQLLGLTPKGTRDDLAYASASARVILNIQDVGGKTTPHWPTGSFDPSGALSSDGLDAEDIRIIATFRCHDLIESDAIAIHKVAAALQKSSRITTRDLKKILGPPGR